MNLDETVIPRSVHDICKAAANAHPDSAIDAVHEASRAVMAMPDFNDFVEAFTHMAVRCVVSDVRHRANVAIKKAAGYYGGEAKVKVAESVEVNKICGSVYAYRIGGTVLGDLYGRDLTRIELAEEGRENGHKFNKLLVRWCNARVPDNERVRDHIPETELAAAFQEIMEGVAWFESRK